MLTKKSAPCSKFNKRAQEPKTLSLNQAQKKEELRARALDGKYL